MEFASEIETYTNTKELPKEYLLLKLRMIFNKELLESRIISFDIYDKMQRFLASRMDKVILEYKT